MKSKIKRRSKAGLGIFILLLTIGCIFITNKLHIKPATFFQVKSAILSKNSIKWDDRLNLLQTRNACASYSSMAFIYSQTGELVDPEFINKNITGKMKNNYTYPWGIVNYLYKHDIRTSIYWHGLMPDSEKIRWIKTKIYAGAPVIVITATDTYLHYISVLGYDPDNFYIYDSVNTTDDNGELSGNRTVSSSELLRMWEKAKYKSIPFNMAVTI